MYDSDMSSSPIGTVSCTAFVRSRGERAEGRRQRRKEEERRGRKGTEENLTTTALTVGKKKTITHTQPGFGNILRTTRLREHINKYMNNECNSNKRDEGTHLTKNA